MKKNYLYLVLFGLLSFATSCESDSLKFEDAVINPNEGTDEIFLGGWEGEEGGDFYQDLQFGFGNDNLPDRVDLSPYLPPVGSQGYTGTCVAWAVGYYTKTVLDAQDGNLSTNDLRNPAQQHSPKDLFWAIPPGLKSPNCNGTFFEHALDVLQSRGVASMQTVPFQNLGDCSSQPQPSWTTEAGENRIESYRQLPLDVEVMKEKLAEGRPLVWGAFLSETFRNWRSGQVMMENTILDGTQGPHAGHAMTIVGYDDAKGAFLIVNSWGTAWGNNGFAWVSYPLMVNSSFSQYIFVAYNSYSENNQPDNTGGNTFAGVDLVVSNKEDNDDPNHPNALYRQLIFDIKNQGNSDVETWEGWDNIYIYYNAYNAHDNGILLHQHVNEWMGNQGNAGPYQHGLGIWDNRWINTELGARESLAEAFTNGNHDAFSWIYKTPNITGQYYLALIVDVFDAVEETNESNNIHFTVGQNGRPINFINGIGEGYHSGDIEDRNSERDPNAYTQDEIRQFILNMKASGRLQQMVSDAMATQPKMIKYEE